MTKAFAWFKKLPAILQNATIVVGLISALGLIVPQIRQNFYTYITITIGSLWVLILFWLISLYFKKTQKRHKHQNKTAFPYRGTSLVGLLILSFIALAVFGTPSSREFIAIGVGLRPTPTPVAFPPADTGQSLMIIAEFDDKSAGKVSGFDLNGRIYRLVTDKIGENNRKTPVKKYPHVIASSEEAKKVLADYKAKVLIWGSYDAVGGRIQIEVDSETVISLMCTHNDFQYSQSDPSKIELIFSENLPVFAAYTSFISLGMIHVDAEAIDEAISFYTQAIDVTTENEGLINPSDAMGYRAFAHFLQDDFDSAIADLKAANPKDVGIFLGLGINYAETDEYDLAIENLSRAIELEPSFCALFTRGQVYADLNENELAKNDYQQALAFAPYAEDYCQLGAGFSRIGDFRSAIAAAEQGLKLDTTNNFCHYVINKAKAGIAVPRE